MKYWDSQEVCIGDHVLADDSKGAVVYIIDTKQGSEKYPVGSWDYLERGMMIDTVEMGLVHYSEPNEAVKLIAREESDGPS